MSRSSQQELSTAPSTEDLRQFAEKVRGWTCNSFAVADHEANAPRLLRKVADYLEHLSAVEILGITFCQDLEGDHPVAVMTAYFAFPDETEPGRTPPGANRQRGTSRRSR